MEYNSCFCRFSGTYKGKEKEMGELIVETNRLTKCFNTQTAVNKVDLKIERGAIYGLIGRNGAGKTTIMKMICGLSTPTSGEISLFGKNVEESRKCLGRIGTLIESPGIYPRLSACDNLKLKCIANGIVNQDKYIKDILELVGLKDAAEKKVGHFSLGMKQRLGIGMALIVEPDICVLDEPINGLDPQGIVEVRELIFKLNRERHITFMISSHILGELDRIASHIGIINKGVLLEQLTNEELHAKCMNRIEIQTSEPERTAALIEEMGYTDYKVVNVNTIYLFDGVDNLKGITGNILKADIPFMNIGICTGNLEEYFLERCGGEDNA